ncbi:MAG TPA: RDD family protein [Candidatus Nanoarchaeia archaeon]|nr:RDD family protein [Candidatus Nanoarchaeia archaeon]
MVRIKLPKPRLFSVPASPMKRAFAFLIDLLILDLIVFFPFRTVISKIAPDVSFSSLNSLMSNPELTSFFVAIAFAMGILSILYFAMLEYRIQQTIGKMLFRISVKSERNTMEFWQCLVRSIFLLPLFPFIVLWVADVLYIFFNQQRQRLLEVVSKTRTMETIMGV